MYKSRSRSMQRGAQYHDHEPFDLGEFYAQHPPVLTRQERANFEFGATDVSKFVSDLAPVIWTLSRAGIRKPREVARQLNKNAIRTAAGDNWKPRLVYFLLSLIFNGRIEHQTRGAGDLLEVSKSVRLSLASRAKQSGGEQLRKKIRVPIEPIESLQRSEPLGVNGPSLLIKAGSKVVKQSKPTKQRKRAALPGIKAEPSMPHARQAIVQSLGKKRRIVVRVERTRS